jgi:ribonuclease BN (tRNA processing enzyme)
MSTAPVIVRFLGSGDAFGSGGRLQSCILVHSPDGRFLIDCGETALIGMKRFGLDSSMIGSIFISHLHGDHYGGLPLLIKEIQISGGRKEPLVIAGPRGLESHVEGLMPLIFPGPENPRAVFWPEFPVISPEEPIRIGGIRATAYPAVHSSMSNPLSLRIECCGRVIAYSGDTEWNDHLPEVSQGADLFICETFEYRREAGNHINLHTLIEHRHELTCRRIVLTHLGESMLERCGSIEFECAQDGMYIEL